MKTKVRMPKRWYSADFSRALVAVGHNVALCDADGNVLGTCGGSAVKDVFEVSGAAAAWRYVKGRPGRRHYVCRVR